MRLINLSVFLNISSLLLGILSILVFAPSVLAAPTTTLTVSESPNSSGWYQSLTATLKCNPGSGGTGCVTKYCYYDISSSQCTPSTTYSFPFSIPNSGKYKIRYFSQDSTGTQGTQTSSEYDLDNLKPTTTSSIGSQPNSDGWYNSGVTITLDPCSDNLSGCGSRNYTTDGSDPNNNSSSVNNNQNWKFSINNTGIYTAKYSSRDKADNREQAKTVSPNPIKIDKDVPVPILTLGGTLGTNGWYTSDVSATINCDNDFSGCKSYKYCVGAYGTTCTPNLNGQTFTISTNGQYTVRYEATDYAGNKDSGKGKDVFIDKSIPTSTFAVTEVHNGVLVTPNSNGWYNQSSIKVAINCSAGVSQCDIYRCVDENNTCTPLLQPGSKDEFDVSGSNIHYVRYYAQNKAGAKENLKTEIIKIDNNNPVPKLNYINEFNFPDNNGQPKKISISCIDDVSGCQTIKYCTSTSFNDCTPTIPYTDPQTVPSDAKRINYTMTDFAGNSTSGKQNLYLPSGEDACTIRVYKDDGAGSVDPSKRVFISRGTGNSNMTLVAGQSYFVDLQVRSGFWQDGCSDCGNAHRQKVFELDPIKVDRDNKTFYDANGVNTGPNRDDILNTLHGTWDPVTGKDNGVLDPAAPQKNNKVGPWRWKFTPTVVGNTVFNVNFSNDINNYSGGDQCTRTTGVVTINNSPPGEFEITSVEPNQCTISQIPSITLTWTASAGADFYEVWRSDDLNLPIATNIPSTQLNYVDTNVEPGVNYSYYIYAMKSSGGEPAEAGWSGSAIPPNCEPLPTVDLKMVIGLNIYDNPPPINSGTNVSLQWETSSSPTSCTATSNPTNPAWSGSVGVQPLNSSPLGALVNPPETQQFSITCSNSSGPSPIDTISATIIPPTPPPFIQTTGGDVHSNERIEP